MSRELKNGLWLTEHRNTAKMGGKDSIMLDHPHFCQARSEGVCKKCYSKRLSAYRPMLAGRQIQNSRILSSYDFEPSELHTVDGTIRWSSMGELDNSQQLRNIIRMAEHNPDVLNVLWTKRHDIIRNINLRPPTNLKLIWSATKIDVKAPKVPFGYDIGFFVYSSEEKIPEGSFRCDKKCSDCNFCYTKGSKGVVAEVIK